MNFIINVVLIEDFVLNLGWNKLKEYGLPTTIRPGWLLENREYLIETSHGFNAFHELFCWMNPFWLKQWFVYKQTLNSIKLSLQKFIFLDAPGETGKTHLINLLK